MTHQSTTLVQRLSTIHSDEPRAIRDEVLEVLHDSFCAEIAAFFKCVEGPDGSYHLCSPIQRSQDAETGRQLEESLRGPAPSAPWLPTETDPEIVDNFVRVNTFYKERRLLSYAMQTEVTRPMGITDHLRAVIYDDRRFVGWIGLGRCGADFRRREEFLASAALHQVKSALVAAESLEADLFDQELFAIFTPDSKLAHATSSFDRWRTPDRAEYLRRRVSDTDKGVDRESIELYDGAEVRLVRLDGGDGVRYLVTVDRAELTRFNPVAQLTERQRQIAEYVAAGATNREVADALDLSPYTVKTHLKNTYTRLGIASRVELAGLL